MKRIDSALVQVRLPPELHKQLIAIASANNRTITKEVRLRLQHSLESVKNIHQEVKLIGENL